MVFLRRICSSRPGDGNSADRAWQLSQLVEGVLTAFNPSHGSLSYVQARRCVSKQIGQHDAARQGCPRCVSRSPETRCLRVFARAVRFFPTCGVVRVADIKLSRYKGENISLLSLPKKQPCEYQFGEKSCTNFLNEAIEQIE